MEGVLHTMHLAVLDVVVGSKDGCRTLLLPTSTGPVDHGPPHPRAVDAETDVGLLGVSEAMVLFIDADPVERAFRVVDVAVERDGDGVDQLSHSRAVHS